MMGLTRDFNQFEKWYGHSSNGSRNRDDGVPEPLSEHIRHVAERAAQFASAFDCSDQAKACGLLHDLGKYTAQFQRRLFDPNERGRDHATIGAVVAMIYGKAFGEIPAICIEGHHSGLNIASSSADFQKRIKSLFDQCPDRFTSTDVKSVIDHFRADGFEIPQFQKGFKFQYDYLGDMLDTRMLYSALVDADFLETEAHFDGDRDCPRRPREEGAKLDPVLALEALESYISDLALQREMKPAVCPPTGSDSQFATTRQFLFKACRAQGAKVAQGLYTLSAPTGAGKTLAMLAFALEHARKHGLRRIVLAMPFLNIVDQTARIYRKIFDRETFGDQFILECHSLADESADRSFADESTSLTQDDQHPGRRRRRLLSENWDAPIILTTSVQLLESLFAHKSSRCRKLHRLAGSVILFDEVQTLPSKLAVATLGALRRLSSNNSPYRTSVVFSTATQPAFDSLSGRLESLIDPHGGPEVGKRELGWRPQELVPDIERLFQAASKRIRVDWCYNQPMTFNQLAEELHQYHQVLVIVNLKRHARNLAELLAEKSDDTFHLSTNMCGQHRLELLDQIKARLDGNFPIKLVATQCVEAGVDLDFPCVYRALAPLEAIAQAAGRCNRSGIREKGVVKVFKPLDLSDDGREKSLYPPGYHSAVNSTEAFLNQIGKNLQESQTWPEIINSPKLLRKYYELLYAHQLRGRGPVEDERELLDAVIGGNFSDVSKHYRLIQQNVINVLVPYDRIGYQELIVQADTAEMSAREVRAWIRRARPHSVAVYRPNHWNSDIWNQLLPLPLGTDVNNESDQGILSGTHDWWRPANMEESYDHFIGLKFAEMQWVL